MRTWKIFQIENWFSQKSELKWIKCTKKKTNDLFICVNKIVDKKTQLLFSFRYSVLFLSRVFLFVSFSSTSDENFQFNFYPTHRTIRHRRQHFDWNLLRDCAFWSVACMARICSCKLIVDFSSLSHCIMRHMIIHHKHLIKSQTHKM